MDIREFQFYFAGFIPYRDRLLIISYENFLMEFDLNKSVIQFAKGLNTEVCGRLAPYHAERFLQIGKNLLIISMWGKEVYIYDAESDRWDMLDIDCHQKEWGNFLGIFESKELVYIVPRYREYIIGINPATKRIQRLNCSFISQLDVENVVSCLKDDFLYFFDGTNHCVSIFYLKTGKCQYIKVDGILGKIAAVQYHENTFYILFESGKTVVWNEQDSSLETVIAPIDEALPACFAQLVVTDKNIWLLPALGEDIYVYDHRDKILEQYEDYPEKLEYLDFENYYKFVAGTRYEDKIYFAMHSANHLLSIDINTGKAEWFYPKFPTVEQADAFRRYHGLSLVKNEKDTSLNVFLHEISQAKEDDEIKYEWKRKLIGSDIWDKLGE